MTEILDGFVLKVAVVGQWWLFYLDSSNSLFKRYDNSYFMVHIQHLLFSFLQQPVCTRNKNVNQTN